MCTINKVTTTHNSVTKTLVDNLSYRPFGSAQGMNAGNGGTVSNIYDQNARLVVANPGAPKEQSYTYDANGNLTLISGASTPWFNKTFTYDALNRLVGATGWFGTINYSYDKVGNRKTITEKGQFNTYNYAPGTNRLNTITGASSVTYIYDANGNVTGINNGTENKVLNYDQNNRLKSVEIDGSIAGEYTYNGLGQRVVKQVGANTIYFIYDFDGNLIAEAALDGSITVSYLYMGETRMARVDTGTGKFYYYLNDSLGSPQMLTDETNTVVWEGLYKPFGEAEVNPNSTVENNFRFPGQYYDEETGLHYNYHRYYDPTSGRYLRSDPIGLDGGINLFAYAENNPINFADVLGLDIELHFFDNKSNPNNIRVYTAEVYVVHEDGTVNGPYRSSTFPNNPSRHNTLLECETYSFNNATGHFYGRRRGLNIVQNMNETSQKNRQGITVLSPVITPIGRITYIGKNFNVHSGVPTENDPSGLN